MKGVVLLFLAFTFSSALSHRRMRITKRSSGNGPVMNSSMNILDENDRLQINKSDFQQNLDHFNPENKQKWTQRYWALTQYFKKDGPAFLFVNGEWSIESGNGGFDYHWKSYAEELNSICFSLEHRFYGKSWPANENMHYLSSRQAIADIAHFIKFANEKYKLPKNIKWIVFGCSYAGSLAAWARLKYPHLIHGAVVSSAPLLAKLDYYEYQQIIEESLKSYHPKCVESISQVTKDIARLVNSTENVKNISEKFQHLCENQPKNMSDVANILLSEMLSILSSATQDANPIDISTVCDTVMNHNGSKLDAFAELRELHRNKSEEYDNEDGEADTADADQLWNYQVCSEFGFLSSYNKTIFQFAAKEVFGDSVKNDIKSTCESFFGPNFGVKELNERISHTNLLYGGLNFNIGNVVFIHGSMDPWHKAGHYRKINEALYEIVFINGTLHCADIFQASYDDSLELKNARKKILKTLKLWLNKKST